MFRPPHPMRSIRIGYVKLFNARGCTLSGRKEVLLRFKIEDVVVEAYVGPNCRHLVGSFQVGPERPTDDKGKNYTTRAQSFTVPSPEIFPADLYTELVATEWIEVEDSLANAFYNKDTAARNDVLKLAEARVNKLSSAVECIAGLIGLRLHRKLVARPISEQTCAYREESSSYALRVSMRINLEEAYQWDTSDENLAFLKERFRPLLSRWPWEEAAKILAWLTRAWAADDPVLEFVSLFIPLECVIPGPQTSGSWEDSRKALLVAVEGQATIPNREELLAFVQNLRPPSPSLNERFGTWAAEVALPGWKNDVAAFQRFKKMRDLLVHAGRQDLDLRITVKQDDVRTLNDIAERYVSLGVFGDANVYLSQQRPLTL